MRPPGYHTRHICSVANLWIFQKDFFFSKKKILSQFLGYQFGAVNTDIFWKEMHLKCMIQFIEKNCHISNFIWGVPSITHFHIWAPYIVLHGPTKEICAHFGNWIKEFNYGLRVEWNNRNWIGINFTSLKVRKKGDRSKLNWT